MSITSPVTKIVTVEPTVVGRKIENTPRRALSVASEYHLSSLLPGLSVNGAAHTHRFTGHGATIRLSDQNLTDKRYFSATGENYIAQGPPRMVKLAVTVRF